MKLKTKFQDDDFELGEVVEAKISYEDATLKVEASAAKGGYHTFYCYSLKELNDLFEDYGGLEDFHYITGDGCVATGTYITKGIRRHAKEIGNCFETKEEAERAVEKLKAWKRLKDRGAKIKEGYNWEPDERRVVGGDIVIRINLPGGYCANMGDLDLLFGGEE